MSELHEVMKVAKKNKKCKICEKMFHACGSCDLHGWEWDYCSSVCWDKETQTLKEISIEIETCCPDWLIELITELEDYELQYVLDQL